MSELDDFLASRKAEIAEGAKEESATGAMYRLMQKIDPIDITYWAHAESKRGTPMTDIVDAMGNYVANVIGPVCLPQRIPEMAAEQVLNTAMLCFSYMLHPGSSVQGLAIKDDGTTFAGMVDEMVASDVLNKERGKS